jgi:hypothetical protein
MFIASGGARNRTWAQFLLGPQPILNIISAVSAALNLQLICSVSYRFSGCFLIFGHSNLPFVDGLIASPRNLSFEKKPTP